MTALKVVEELNQNLWDRFEDTNQEYFFYYISSGMTEAILFNEEVIWDTENDERKWIEGEDGRSGEYEELLPFIKNEFNKYLDRINKFKFDEKL